MAAVETPKIYNTTSRKGVPANSLCYKKLGYAKGRRGRFWYYFFALIVDMAVLKYKLLIW